MAVGQKNVIDAAVRRMTELDAAGWGIVLLRCDREGDICRTVEGYVHAARYVPKNKASDWKEKNNLAPAANVREVTGMGTVKRCGVPFSWREHAPEGGDIGNLDHGAEPSLMNQLIRCIEPSSALEHQLIYFPNIYEIIGNPENTRTPVQMQYIQLLREIGRRKRRAQSKALIVLGSTDGVLCRELREYTYVLDIDYPDREELREIIYDACQSCSGSASGLEPSVANELAEMLRGLRQDDVRGIINLAYAQCENPLASGAKTLFGAAKDAKRQRIAGIRGLRWIDNDKKLDVGGFETLKKWLDRRKLPFLYPHAAKRQHAKAPKGLLLVGLPGCGKTYLAKQTAQLLGDGKASVPLMQLDLNAMLGKWLGEAEANCDMALRAVESVAPAVLLVDEIEKVFGGVTDGGSNDAMMHIFASFLDWMQQEREKPVLVIATANKVERLPPELKRKGRFDETFFCGVPTRKDCEEILRIHLRRNREVLPEQESDSGEYAEIIDRFFRRAAREKRFVNGADIETIVNSALCLLFELCSQAELEQDDEADAEPIRYSQEAVIEALEQELSDTRSYFDSNLQTTARYWIDMEQLDFREAGGGCLLDKQQYDERSGMFGGMDLPTGEKSGQEYRKKALENIGKCAEEGDYDGALRYTLAAQIYEEVCMRGGNGR